MQHLLKLSRSEIPQSRMKPLVHVDIFDKPLYMSTSIMNGFILMKVNFLLLKGFNEPFCIAILPGHPFGSHGYLYPCISKKRKISIRKILYPMITMVNLGLCFLKCFLQPAGMVVLMLEAFFKISSSSVSLTTSCSSWAILSRWGSFPYLLLSQLSNFWGAVHSWERLNLPSLGAGRQQHPPERRLPRGRHGRGGGCPRRVRRPLPPGVCRRHRNPHFQEEQEPFGGGEVGKEACKGGRRDREACGRPVEDQEQVYRASTEGGNGIEDEIQVMAMDDCAIACVGSMEAYVDIGCLLYTSDAADE